MFFLTRCSFLSFSRDLFFEIEICQKRFSSKTNSCFVMLFSFKNSLFSKRSTIAFQSKFCEMIIVLMSRLKKRILRIIRLIIMIWASSKLISTIQHFLIVFKTWWKDFSNHFNVFFFSMLHNCISHFLISISVAFNRLYYISHSSILRN